MKEDSFEIIPAIDILGGKCVRLTQGKYDLIEEFSNKVEEVAKRWIDAGAKRLHVVDLDGAKEGYPVNYEVITKLVRTQGINKVQVGGGIRTLQTIRNYLDAGTSYVVLSTKAFQDRNFLEEVLELYGERIIVGLDIKSNRVALSGWYETMNIGIDKLVDHIGDAKQIIYTNVTKDGTLSGPDLNSIETITSYFKSKMVISGGISHLDDILAILNIKKQRHPNISGVILGKSLYKGTIDLSSAIKVVSEILDKDKS